MVQKKKTITNQDAINEANKKNKAALDKGAKAQAEKDRLAPAVPVAEKVIKRAKSSTSLAERIGKKTGDVKKSQSIIDKFNTYTTQVRNEILSPFEQASKDIQDAFNSRVTVPKETYDTEGDQKTNSLTAPDVRTTNITVLKSLLKAQGFNAAIIDSSASYLQKLLIQENLDYDNAVEVFLNSKDYSFSDGTTVTSPFYTEYGYLNEGLTNPKSPRELYGAVEGYKGVIDTYKMSKQFLSSDSLKGYVKNNVTVADLAERANMASIRSLETDVFQVEALRKQGFIGTSSDLVDFYMDSKIGKEQLEINRQTGVFTAEALRREKAGVLTSETQLAGFRQLTATLAAKGYSEAQISQLAATGFENIAQSVDDLAKYAGIYEKAGGTVESNLAVKEGLQSSLLEEEFKGTESARRKRLLGQNLRAFQATSGTMGASLTGPKTSGLI
jgi:hypothetical protein